MVDTRIAVPYSNMTRNCWNSDIGFTTNTITIPMPNEEYNKIISHLRSDCSNPKPITTRTFAFDKHTPKKIIYNGKATIVFWKDGTKTIVKKAEGEPYNRYNAFCAALAKKVFGNNSVVNRFVKNGIEQK